MWFNYYTNDTRVANETGNVVLEHIQAKCPSLTVGQVNAIYTMMKDQLDDSEDNKILDFYIKYLNDSSDYPIPGLNMTAHEIIKSSGNNYYKTKVNILESVIDRYGHMNKDEQVQFLINHDPTMKTVMDIFSSSTRSEQYYLANSIGNFTIPEFPQSIDIRKINRYKTSVEASVQRFAKDIQQADMAYKLNGNLMIDDGVDWRSSFTNKIQLLNNSIQSIDTAKKPLLYSGVGILTVGIIFASLAGLSKIGVLARMNCKGLSKTLPKVTIGEGLIESILFHIYQALLNM